MAITGNVSWMQVFLADGKLYLNKKIETHMKSHLCHFDDNQRKESTCKKFEFNDVVLLWRLQPFLSVFGALEMKKVKSGKAQQQCENITKHNPKVKSLIFPYKDSTRFLPWSFLLLNLRHVCAVFSTPLSHWSQYVILRSVESVLFLRKSLK